MIKTSKIMTLSAMAIFLTFINSAKAQEELPQEERVDHYAAAEILNTEQAKATIKISLEEIEKILSAAQLQHPDMERIHEISYALEASVDRLIEEKAAAEGKIDEMNEAVQALHFASENHEEAKVREWHATLKTAVAALSEDIVKEGTDTEVTAVLDPEKTEYEILIKDHKFAPETIKVPAGKKIKLIVRNLDPTPEEFESHDLKREKIIAGNAKATIFVGPLEPGKYHFFGEFNMDSANGYVIAE